MEENNQKQKTASNQNKNNGILKKPWASYTRREKWLVVGGILFVLWFIGVVQMAVLGGKNYIPTSVQTSQPTIPKLPTYEERLPRFLSFVCSKPEDSHKAYYYFVNNMTSTESFPLSEKLVDVDVRISTIRNDRKNWDTGFLCSSESIVDLPDYQWQILTAGSDCGVGATIEPCDINFISDANGVTGIIIAPKRRSDGYTSGVTHKYFREGALLKITGIPVK